MSIDFSKVFRLNTEYPDNSKLKKDRTKNEKAVFEEQLGKSLKDSSKEKELESLKEVSKQFEGILVHQIMKSMRNTVMKSDLLGDRSAEDTFQSMLDEEYSKRIGQQERYGLAAKIFEQLSKNIQ